MMEKEKKEHLKFIGVHAEVIEFMEKQESVFITSFPGLHITDDRDILKFAERKQNKCRSPFREEIYTYNPLFNGKYNSCQCGKCNDN